MKVRCVLGLWSEGSESEDQSLIVRLSQVTQRFRTDSSLDTNEEVIEKVEAKAYIKRDILYPEYEVLDPLKVEAYGTADFSYVCEEIHEDRSYTDIGETLLGYQKGELKEHLSTYNQMRGRIEGIMV